MKYIIQMISDGKILIPDLTNIGLAIQKLIGT